MCVGIGRHIFFKWNSLLFFLLPDPKPPAFSSTFVKVFKRQHLFCGWTKKEPNDIKKKRCDVLLLLSINSANYRRAVGTLINNIFNVEKLFVGGRN